MTPSFFLSSMILSVHVSVMTSRAALPTDVVIYKIQVDLVNLWSTDADYCRSGNFACVDFCEICDCVTFYEV